MQDISIVAVTMPSAYKLGILQADWVMGDPVVRKGGRNFTTYPSVRDNRNGGSMILYGDLARSFLLQKYRLSGKLISYRHVFPNPLSGATTLKDSAHPVSLQAMVFHPYSMLNIMFCRLVLQFIQEVGDLVLEASSVPQALHVPERGQVCLTSPSCSHGCTYGCGGGVVGSCVHHSLC
jgi:hypothetical protein